MGVATNLTIQKSEYNTGFTQVPNEIICSSTLSSSARTIFMALLRQRDSSFTPVNEHDKWKVTLEGLSRMVHLAVGTVKRGMDQLIKAGYVVRVDVFSKQGRRTGCQYVLFTTPLQDPDGKPRHVREDELENGLSLVDVANPPKSETKKHDEALEKEACKEVIAESIEAEIIYEDLCEDQNEPLSPEKAQEEVQEITDVICDAVCNHEKTIYIEQKPVKPLAVKEALFKLSREDIMRVLKAIRKRKKHIQNRKHYILAALYQAGKNKHHSTGEKFISIAEIKQMLSAIKQDKLSEWLYENFHLLTNLSQRVVEQYIYHHYADNKELLQELRYSMNDFKRRYGIGAVRT